MLFVQTVFGRRVDFKSGEEHTGKLELICGLGQTCEDTVHRELLEEMSIKL